MNLSEITCCIEYSSNFPDDRKIVKLIVVNLKVIFYLKPIYIYICASVEGENMTKREKSNDKMNLTDMENDAKNHQRIN